MPTTDQDARALTYLAKRLREETHGANRWDEAGIWAVVAKSVGRNLAVTIEQVTHHAADPTAKTPGAITRPFLPDAPKPEPQRPPKRGEDCDRHPGQWAESCGGCAADRLAGDQTTAADPRRPTADDARRAAREALTTTRLGLCGHGVQRVHCRQDHDESAEDVAEMSEETA